MSSIPVNATASFTFVVQSRDLASAICPENVPDQFPRILATSRLVAVMEIASARLLQPLLAPGQLSVGVSMSITHSAPTPEGARITAEATYVGKEGEKLFCFEVVATDGGGEVGRARHERAVVDVARLERRALKRVEEQSRA